MAFNFWSGKYLKQNARQTSQDRVKENRKKRTEPGTKYSAANQNRQELTPERRTEIQRQARRQGRNRIYTGLLITTILGVGIAILTWYISIDYAARNALKKYNKQFEIWYYNKKVEQQNAEYYTKMMQKGAELMIEKEYSLATRSYGKALRAVPNDSAALLGCAKATLLDCRHNRWNCQDTEQHVNRFVDLYGHHPEITELNTSRR